MRGGAQIEPRKEKRKEEREEERKKERKEWNGFSSSRRKEHIRRRGGGGGGSFSLAGRKRDEDLSRIDRAMPGFCETIDRIGGGKEKGWCTGERVSERGRERGGWSSAMISCGVFGKTMRGISPVINNKGPNKVQRRGGAKCRGRTR